jgi:hypothetical protein
MTEVNVNDLNEAGLDWAVAICEKAIITGRGPDGKLHIANCNRFAPGQSFAPSSDHWTGDEIIARENIVVSDNAEAGGYRAVRMESGVAVPGSVAGFGRTPLIAAMRCHVANTLGSRILVPDESAKPLTSHFA